TLYESHGVFTKAELNSRHDIRMEAYEKTLHIEALTMLDITKTAIIPAILDYENKLTNTALANFISDRLTPLTETLVKNIQALESAALPENIKALRATVDALELIIPRNSWPMPTYGEIFASFSGL
ncbi:MAG: glutamine synthetase type III, partial [Defluviitaleaceae bacterium]|nr:glutamine synthetase type III [Defluviitaleaceae bacterium]